MKTEAKTREKYFAQVGEREAALRELDELIQKTAPSLKPKISGGITGKMLGYGSQKYKPKSAKTEAEWPVLMMALQKNYISIYACAVIEGKYIAEMYEKKLGKVSCGKSCIRFKKPEDLNKEGLKEMLKDIDSRVKKGENLYGY